MITKTWKKPVTVTENHFKHKSLSDWSCNIAVGCSHSCRFCFVPEVSTRKMGPLLKPLGVDDPDAEWGNYVFPRSWDENAFLNSVRRADRTPIDKLNKNDIGLRDGNRAVMLCTTTDPYMVVTGPDAKNHNDAMRANVRRALEIIRDHSTLNVRILTRSPLARLDFDVMESFGNRLMFGMSLPTLDNQLAEIYEPKAPAPTQRLETLKKAKERGLHVYVAVAPTYPECDDMDLRATLLAVAALNPLTVYHEPINIRAENVERIRKHAESLGRTVKTEVFATPQTWANYSIQQLFKVEEIAWSIGLGSRLHLWPDDALAKWASKEWLNRYWNRVSEWPQ